MTLVRERGPCHAVVTHHLVIAVEDLTRRHDLVVRVTVEGGQRPVELLGHLGVHVFPDDFEAALPKFVVDHPPTVSRRGLASAHRLGLRRHRLQPEVQPREHRPNPEAVALERRAQCDRGVPQLHEVQPDQAHLDRGDRRARRRRPTSRCRVRRPTRPGHDGRGDQEQPAERRRGSYSSSRTVISSPGTAVRTGRSTAGRPDARSRHRPRREPSGSR